MTSHVSLTDEAIDSDTQLLRARGELDLYAAPELKRRMAEAIEGGKTRIVVDLTDAAFMDSTALGVLISALKRLRLREGALAIASDQPSILRILEVTGMDQVLIVRSTADEALAAVSGPPDEQG
jgi:anti-sigma B factor antagonist